MTFSNSGAVLCFIIGNYCKILRKSLFGGDIHVTKWQRIPANYQSLIPCVENMIETEGAGLSNWSDNLN